MTSGAPVRLPVGALAEPLGGLTAGDEQREGDRHEDGEHGAKELLHPPVSPTPESIRHSVTPFQPWHSAHPSTPASSIAA